MRTRLVTPHELGAAATAAAQHRLQRSPMRLLLAALLASWLGAGALGSEVECMTSCEELQPGMPKTVQHFAAWECMALDVHACAE